MKKKRLEASRNESTQRIRRNAAKESEAKHKNNDTGESDNQEETEKHQKRKVYSYEHKNNISSHQRESEVIDVSRRHGAKPSRKRSLNILLIFCHALVLVQCVTKNK